MPRQLRPSACCDLVRIARLSQAYCSIQVWKNQFVSSDPGQIQLVSSDPGQIQFVSSDPEVLQNQFVSSDPGGLDVAEAL
jgi:hypothetical protein